VCAITFFASFATRIRHFLAEFSNYTSDFAVVFANRGVKTPNSRPRRNPPGTSLPQPFQAEILRLGKTAVSPLSGPAKAA
jgi:hypothetical protein